MKQTGVVSMRCCHCAVHHGATAPALKELHHGVDGRWRQRDIQRMSLRHALEVRHGLRLRADDEVDSRFYLTLLQHWDNRSEVRKAAHEAAGAVPAPPKAEWGHRPEVLAPRRGVTVCRSCGHKVDNDMKRAYGRAETALKSGRDWITCCR